MLCGFPALAGCSATGSCFPSPGVICNAYVAGCACDGSEVNTACNGLPTGYAPKPLLHSGACVVAEAGAACTSDTQCGPGYKCCYPCGAAPPACSNKCIAVPAGSACPAYP
jgi:hypothetical protein